MAKWFRLSVQGRLHQASMQCPYSLFVEGVCWKRGCLLQLGCVTTAQAVCAGQDPVPEVRTATAGLVGMHHKVSVIAATQLRHCLQPDHTWAAGRCQMIDASRSNRKHVEHADCASIHAKYYKGDALCTCVIVVYRTYYMWLDVFLAEQYHWHEPHSTHMARARH